MDSDAPTRGGLLRVVAYGTDHHSRQRPPTPQGWAVALGIRPAKIPWTGRRAAVGVSPPPSLFDGRFRRPTRPARIRKSPFQIGFTGTVEGMTSNPGLAALAASVPR